MHNLQHFRNLYIHDHRPEMVHYQYWVDLPLGVANRKGEEFHYTGWFNLYAMGKEHLSKIPNGYLEVERKDGNFQGRVHLDGLGEHPEQLCSPEWLFGICEQDQVLLIGNGPGAFVESDVFREDPLEEFGPLRFALHDVVVPEMGTFVS